MRRQETTTATEIAPFDLKIPAEFEVKPDHEVEMPKGYKALIFNMTVWDRTAPDKMAVPKVPAWRVIIVNKAGVVPERVSTYYNTDHVFTTEFDVQNSLRLWARTLSKVKKTRTETVEPGDDE
jgi:hypothetical protein